MTQPGQSDSGRLTAENAAFRQALQEIREEGCLYRNPYVEGEDSLACVERCPDQTTWCNPCCARRVLDLHAGQPEATDGEVCGKCGRPVAATTGGRYWLASDELWQVVEGFAGDAESVRCIPCFAADADAAGVLIRWEAHPERDGPVLHAGQKKPND